VRVEQHLVALARVGHQPEGPDWRTASCARPAAGSRCRRPPGLFAPVELEGLAELEAQRHEGVGRHRLAFALAPRAHEVGDAAVAAVVARSADLAYSARAVRRSCAGAARRPSRPAERFVEGLSLPGISPRRYFGGPSTSPCSHLATVLRDSPVMRAISRSDFLPGCATAGSCQSCPW
jgi:hypothetical protein